MRPILFASGDIGGARALLPIIRRAATHGNAPIVVRNGPIASEGDSAWRWAEPSTVDFGTAIDRPQAMIFASSLKDTIALGLARKANISGLRVLHVLDSWATYVDRLRTDGLGTFTPDVYCVPDEIAAEDAARDGVPERIIAITGQPAFGDVLLAESGREAGRRDCAHLLLVSEPVEADQGQTRGYTETGALGLVLEALQPLAGRMVVSLLPHPRDDPAKVADLWHVWKGALDGKVLQPHSVRTLSNYDAVAGMASVLLYRAWLVGLPVLSCQPDLRLPSLRQFGRRPGIVMIDEMQAAHERVCAWARSIVPNQRPQPRPEARMHAAAAETILSLARATMCGAAT